MAVQDFECQIAKAQIGRYLQGDALSSEAVNQLEAHIARCPSCKEAVSAKRKALQAMLGWTPEPEAAAPVAVKPEVATQVAEAAVRGKAVAQLQEVVAATKKRQPGQGSMVRPLALSAGLALVLIAMSYITRGNSPVLGSKVIETLPTSTEAQVQEPAPAPVQTKAPSAIDAGAPQTTVEQPTTPQPPITDSASATSVASSAVVRSEPQVKVRRRPARRAAKKHAAPKPAPAPKDNSIRVYDEAGNPVR